MQYHGRGVVMLKKSSGREQRERMMGGRERRCLFAGREDETQRAEWDDTRAAHTEES